MNELILIKGWHVLFTGANGHETQGITVRSTSPKSEVEDEGRIREYDLNDYILANNSERIAEMLGIDNPVDWSKIGRNYYGTI